VTVTTGLKEASATSTIGQDGRITKSYKHKYLYRTTAGSRPTFADIAADLGIAPGSPYADDLNATAGNAEIEHLMTRPPHCAAEVTIVWSTNNPVPAEDSTDPSTVRTLWDLQTIIQQRYITKDRNGKLIVNSAGQPFDGGVPADVRLGQATAKLKVLTASFDKSIVMKHSGKLNSSTFLGAAAGTLQVDISASQAVEGSYDFFNVTYVFTYDPLGHQPKPANVGFFWKVPFTGEITPITVADLEAGSTDPTRVQEPEPLYDAAAEAADPTHVEGTVVPYSDRPDGCSFVSVDYYDTMDFATLPGM
jgi:hypothetical protein